MNARPKSLGYLTFIVLIFGVLLRVLYLDSDPRYYDWIGYMTDEGRWIFQARKMARFGAVSHDKLEDFPSGIIFAYISLAHGPRHRFQRATRFRALPFTNQPGSN